MAKRKTKTSSLYPCEGRIPFVIGIALLIAAAMMYLGYNWMEIFIVLGVLAILKGIHIYIKK